MQSIVDIDIIYLTTGCTSGSGDKDAKICVVVTSGDGPVFGVR